MDMPIYDYVLEQAAAADLTYQQISDGSGIPKRTVEKILRKEVESPNVHHMQALHDFFRARETVA